MVIMIAMDKNNKTEYNINNLNTNTILWFMIMILKKNNIMNKL